MYRFNGIKSGGPSCYNNGLWGDRRVVFMCEHYFMLPDGMDEDAGYHVLYVGTGPHVCKANLKFAGQYHDLRELTTAMLMMLGSDELRHEYGSIVAFRDYVDDFGREVGASYQMSFA